MSGPAPRQEPSETTPNEQGTLDRIVRIGQLLDLYGGLLTERQRDFMTLHYEEDLSFGEIARTHEVSRQAVHDAVKHAEEALETYEAKLLLLQRGIVPPAAKDLQEDTSPDDVEDALWNAANHAALKLRQVIAGMNGAALSVGELEVVRMTLAQVADDLESVLG